MKTESFTTLDNQEPYFVIIPNDLAGTRIDSALAIIIPELSRTVITNWLKAGAIQIENKTVKPKDKVIGSEKVLIIPLLSNEELAYKPENIALNIIYEDEYVIVINKPAGLTVHPGNGNWSGTLLNGLLHHYPELKNLPRAGIVHRLDKDTSGLMVVARNALAQLKLVEQLQNRSVSRIYRAIVEGRTPPTGSIQKNIGRDLHNRTKMAALAVGGKEAITHFRSLKVFNEFSYIECKLETGRTHQIRVHMKSIYHPLAGDQTYGSNKINYPANISEAIIRLNRQALHALKLSFNHPKTDEIVSFSSNLPEDIRYLLSQLELDHNAANTAEEPNYADGEDNWEVLYVNE